MKFPSMCQDCGEKRVPKVNQLNGITVSMGTCPICGKETWIIPSSDWEYQAGDNSKWD
jgi:hypothetical protein